ncbi:9551_t:CDS:1, partial [Acaulospora morrowiae]
MDGNNKIVTSHLKHRLLIKEMFIGFFKNFFPKVTLSFGDLPSADVVLLESQANGNYQMV